MRFRAFVVALLAALFVITPALPANAEKGCVLDILGIKVCGELLTPLPTVTVPGPTVTLPGKTVTLAPKPPVTISGPTRTVLIPGPTSTVTTRPNTTDPTVGPTSTITLPSGQDTTMSATVTTKEPSRPTPTSDTHTIETIIKYGVVGTLISLAIAGLGLLLLFLGYILGRKDERRNQVGFYRSLLQSVRGERQ